jgi:hypothetical protein
MVAKYVQKSVCRYEKEMSWSPSDSEFEMCTGKPAFKFDPEYNLGSTDWESWILP